VKRDPVVIPVDPVVTPPVDNTTTPVVTPPIDNPTIPVVPVIPKNDSDPIDWTQFHPNQPSTGDQKS